VRFSISCYTFFLHSTNREQVFSLRYLTPPYKPCRVALGSLLTPVLFELEHVLLSFQDVPSCSFFPPQLVTPSYPKAPHTFSAHACPQVDLMWIGCRVGLKPLYLALPLSLSPPDRDLEGFDWTFFPQLLRRYAYLVYHFPLTLRCFTPLSSRAPYQGLPHLGQDRWWQSQRAYSLSSSILIFFSRDTSIPEPFVEAFRPAFSFASRLLSPLLARNPCHSLGNDEFQGFSSYFFLLTLPWQFRRA